MKRDVIKEFEKLMPKLEKDLSIANDNIDKNPNHYECYIERAKVFINMMKYQDAEKDFETAISSFKKTHFLDKDYYALLSKIFNAKIDQQKKKIRFLEYFIKHKAQPPADLALTRRNTIIDITNSLENLIGQKKYLDSYNKRDIIKLLTERSKQYFDLNEYAKAISDLLESEKYDLDDKHTNLLRWKMLAENYEGLNDIKKINHYCEKIISNTHNFSFLEFTASIREKNELISEAIDNYTKLISIRGNSHPMGFIENRDKPKYLIKRGLLKEKLIKKEEAYKDYIEAYKLDNKILMEYPELSENENLKAYLQENFYN
jgi:hypothetical protein